MIRRATLALTVALPLFDSEWVLGSEERLARIVIRGMTGKVTVNKRTYEMEMPPLEALTDARSPACSPTSAASGATRPRRSMARPSRAAAKPRKAARARGPRTS